MNPPVEWPDPPEPLTRVQQIERLVRLRQAINTPDSLVNLNEIFNTMIDALLDTLKN